MGSVYAVRHTALDKRFAMKVMRADLAQQGELAARFIQEARATAAIGHPNIVQITDFGQLPSGAPYFVMELLEGTPLSKMIRLGGPLPAGLAVRTLQQTAAALAAAHAAGVIHRDLKPDNIHITRDNLVKVLDFGVAKMAGAGRLTRTGMVFGTPHYMSPEQASGNDVDRRADIYALGIIMYEMFTGRVPFEADSYMGVLTKHMYMLPEPPSHVHEAARALGALEDVTLRCLEKKPEARYASMNELIADVESIVHFNDDKLEILRPSSHFRKPARVSVLADELEPPEKDELRAAGVPAKGLPNVFVFVGLGTCLAAVFIAIYVLVQPWASEPSGGDSLPATSSAGSPAALVPAAPALVVDPPAPREELPPPSVATATPPSERAPAAASGRPRREKRAPRVGQGRALSAPTSAHTAFGSGDIVNPWAK
jgi:serine/threonine protein kinase